MFDVRRQGGHHIAGARPDDILPEGAPLRVSADAQLQVFQCSFTTNGVGRGLGPDSMQLLSGYLGGEVGF